MLTSVFILLLFYTLFWLSVLTFNLSNIVRVIFFLFFFDVSPSSEFLSVQLLEFSSFSVNIYAF